MDANAEEVVVTGLEIEAAELAAKLDAGEVELIDVRRDYEFETGHIPGARHVRFDLLTRHADSIPKDRPIVFYCRGGGRSATAAQAFHEAGHDAHNLAGGLHAWVDTENPIEPIDGHVAEPRPV